MTGLALRHPLKSPSQCRIDLLFFFFFQAEDGIRDYKVTGVQTCALPIWKNDVQFGGGYSEGTGFFVQTQFSTRNFLGEGENLGLSFQRGNRQNFYSLSYADPWFMDTPNSFGVSLFNRNTDFPLSVGYQERSKGGSVAYGYRLHRFDSLSLVYGLEHVRTHEESNLQPDVNGNVPISDISDLTYTSSSIGPSYGFDSRDNPFDTTRGGRGSCRTDC